MPLNNEKYFLFSIDFEDIRFLIKDGHQYSERLPILTDRFLDFFNKQNVKTTFFVVGDVARAFPSTIQKIADEGHEIACHSNKHTTIDKLTPSDFYADVKDNLKAINDCGIKKIYGYRAPIYSLTSKTSWAHEVLSDLGFIYSSSVLPAKNLMYGWHDFGENIKIVKNIIEMPITLYKTPFGSIPLVGGVYMRIMPYFIMQKVIQKKWENNLPILSYTHPYDIDTEQERFMHPEINNKLMNKLMYVNRRKLLNKVEKILNIGGTIIPYHEYINFIKPHLYV